MIVPDGMGEIDAREVAHGLLLAVLAQHHGGMLELDLSGLEGSMGDAAGRLWSVAIEPVDGDPTRVRLVVVHVARADQTP